ncbi:MAG: hypothetical protein ABF264_03035 [Flavobacteriales bacterium]|jgi:hypothetical protein
MRIVLKHIALFFSLLTIANHSYAQDDFDVDEYLDEINYHNNYEKSTAHIQYLKDSISIVPFDRKKWERLRLNIVNEISGVEYEGQDGSSFTQEDNPYRKSERAFRKYWRERNSKEIKRIPKKKEEYEPRSTGSNDLFNPGKISPFWSNFILVLVILALAALVFFLFFHKMKDSKGNKKFTRDLDSIIPTEIPKTELELLLEKALQKEDYREAIRVYFIFVIRGLIKKDLIVWEKEKTNFSFLMEMRGNPNFESFEKCVSVYEIVWYGERQLSKIEYLQVEPRFKNLVKKLDE